MGNPPAVRTPTYGEGDSESASGPGATFGDPAILFGTATAAGSIDEVIRRDATLRALDTLKNADAIACDGHVE